VISYLRTPTTWHCPHSPDARRRCSSWSISPARWAQDSKPAGLLVWTHFGTDRQTDTVPFLEPCSTYYAVTLAITETWLDSETSSTGARSAGAVSGLVLLLIVVVMTLILALVWRRYRIKARQRRLSQLACTYNVVPYALVSARDRHTQVSASLPRDRTFAPPLFPDIYPTKTTIVDIYLPSPDMV